MSDKSRLPFVTALVHYQHGTDCLAAMVIQLDEDQPHRVGLCVFDPRGIHTIVLERGGVPHGDEPHNWHWPEAG